MPITEVVFFTLKGGKYLTSNGIEVTTSFLLEREHAMFHDSGYVVVKSENHTAHEELQAELTRLKKEVKRLAKENEDYRTANIRNNQY